MKLIFLVGYRILNPSGWIPHIESFGIPNIKSFRIPDIESFRIPDIESFWIPDIWLISNAGYPATSDIRPNPNNELYYCIT